MAKGNEVILPPPPPSWVMDLNSAPVPSSRSNSSIPDPPGYISMTGGGGGSKKQISKTSNSSSTATTIRTPPTPAEMYTLKLKKAWEVALAPVKQLPMTFIMMYMSGNSLQIFSIMMVVMAFKNPVMGLVGTGPAFERFEGEGMKSRLGVVKAVYVLMQLLALGVGVWKVNAMGLLPTTRSDWLAWETAREPLERAVNAF